MFFSLYHLSTLVLTAMIKIFSKTYKIRLVGPFCSRDYFHAFPHCIELIIDVTNTILQNLLIALIAFTICGV